jgi:Homeodomain-like domain
MIELTDAERVELERFIRRGKANARNITRAHVLLKSAEGWSIARTPETYQVSQATVSKVRQRYGAGGLDRVLKDKVQHNRRRAVGGEAEAVMVAIACSPVPDGHDHGTLRMVRDKLVELGVVAGISASTIQDRLKQMNSSPGSVSSGVCRKRSTKALWQIWKMC